MISNTVKMYLPTGNVEAVAEITSFPFDIKCIYFARDNFKDFMKLNGSEFPGVYILIQDRTEETNGKYHIYIGETDCLSERLNRHKNDNRAEMWEKTLVFTTLSEQFNKAHVQHLEYLLLEEIKSGGRVVVENDHIMKDAVLSISEKEQLVLYFEQLKRIIKILNYPFFKINDNNKNIEDFYLDKAKLKIVDRSIFILTKGSIITEVDSPTSRAMLFRKELIEKQQVKAIQNGLELLEDIEVTSISFAAGLVKGSPTSGRSSWKNSIGKTLNELE